jgi:6-phosphogluconolactonase
LQTLQIKIFPTLDALSATAASAISELARNAISERGQFTIALSGGNTPRVLYEILAKDYNAAMDWSHVHFFFGDERFVPQDDPASNYRMVKESLIEHLPIPQENIHPINTTFASPEEAAADYSSIILSFFSQEVPSFDLILLGLGNDGHTASLFPGMSEQEMKEGIAIATRSPVAPLDRISISLSILQNARNVFFLVAGEEKKQILKSVLTDVGNPASKYPAARVSPRGQLMWFTDEAAHE